MDFSRQSPSPRYRQLMSMYRQMHEEGERFLNIPPDQTFPGKSLLAQAGRIRRLIVETGAKSILDYGSGKGQQYLPKPVKEPDGPVYPSIQAYWGVERIQCYDPCHVPFSALPEGQFDGVICTDVIEHCPEEDLDWILEEIFAYATKFVFANIACWPASKRLPNGENAHATIKPVEWWVNEIRPLSARHPHLKWEIWLSHLSEEESGGKVCETRLVP